ncbi:glycosyl hydrolases family 43 domain-containing protein [Sarocladium implicatum]|nr:glycosyl hydrolases family 43 domain-containing protein [Sarocladium implicatum]
MKLTNLILLAGLAVVATAQNSTVSSTWFNPVLPGWHSDPSCTVVGDTFFCATSTFIAFPGLPVYASKDLINWRLASHGWNRESQLPGISWNTWGQQDGMYAPTLRYRDGEFFLICEYLGQNDGIIGVVFRTTDPFDDDAWSDPVIFRPDRIDPDIFWDDDGKVYTATQGIILQELNLETGELSQPPIELWNGTGGVWPEAPHIYKKDGWYYLMIAEGGTATDHAVTIARAPAVDGPYEPYEGNPILTNRGTDQYIQTVGHADLFQDPDGNWWGLALATRSGPEYNIYPMGRESVLFNATWEEGEWPVLEPVRGHMSGWPLPSETRDIPGDKPFNGDPDSYDFTDEDASIPANFVHWRVPREGSFSSTAQGLRVVPSRANLTGQTDSDDLSGRRGLSFIGRRQTHTIFDFSVDLTFSPSEANEEAGVTIFLTQFNHIDLGIVLSDSGKKQLRFHAEGTGASEVTELSELPESLADAETVRLWVTTPDEKSFEVRIGSTDDDDEGEVIGTGSGALLSGGTGSFVGSLVGVYATCNGNGEGQECPEGTAAYFTNWRYEPIAQFVSAGDSIPAEDHPTR